VDPAATAAGTECRASALEEKENRLSAFGRYALCVKQPQNKRRGRTLPRTNEGQELSQSFAFSYTSRLNMGCACTYTADCAGSNRTLSPQIPQ
jgi:hypothetical protein